MPRQCRQVPQLPQLPEGGLPGYLPGNGKAVIDRTQCVGCTVCAQVCPFDAIEKEEK